MLFLSQGVPMIFSGDEFGSSQAGNNNPYCQDNETGWVDWKALERNSDFFEYVKFLSNLRFSNRVLHEKTPFRLMDYISCGYPDFSAHGREAWRPDMSGHSHLLGMLFCGLYEKDEPFVYVSFNMNWTNQELALPKLPEGYKWKIVSDTDERGLKIEKPKTKAKSGSLKKYEADSPSAFTELMADRSVRIYISEKDSSFIKKKTTKRKTK
jgi:glycogen operon protein